MKIFWSDIRERGGIPSLLTFLIIVLMIEFSFLDFNRSEAGESFLKEFSYSIFSSLPARLISSESLMTKDNLTEVSLTEESMYRILVDVGINREFVYYQGDLIMENPISSGSPDRYSEPYETPLGKWRVISKEKTTGVYGPFFLRLAWWNGVSFVPTNIGLHGTNEPEMIGFPASHGCIRHYNSVIEKLANFIPVGTIVETY